MFSVVERESGRWVGRVGPWEPEGWPRREIAWGVAREFAGRGYAQEAAVAAIDYAVDLLGWTDIAHHIDPANARSIRLAERLGAGNRGPTRLPPPLDGLNSTIGARAPSAGAAAIRLTLSIFRIFRVVR